MIHTHRIEKAQARMRELGMDAYMILTHDDYIYFFGDDRYQPRAILPSQGDPIIVTFRGEEDEVRALFGVEKVKIFGTVGQQIRDVVESMRALTGDKERLKVGIQMGFFTPHFLVQMFSRANPQVEVMDIAPVMDPLRMIKEPDELENIRRACQIAEVGMAAAVRHLKPGVTENQVGAEIEYAMRKAGGQGTATPVFVNSGLRSAWLHGTATEKSVEAGDLVVVNLVPRFKGYCANLCRTFVVGEPDEKQQKMYDTYLKAQQAAISAMKPGVIMRQIDEAAQAVFTEAGYGEYYVPGISHSIGLMFEENPMPTLHPNHTGVELRAGMTLTAGHSVFSIPGYGGVRAEDTLYLDETGATALTRFPQTLSLTEAASSA